MDEADAHLLGDPARLRGADVLEVGAGAAQCSRWLLDQGARAVALDLSGEQLRHARTLDADRPVRVPLVQADAEQLPFADASFDIVCSAFGAVPFVADSGAVMAEVARVLRPGGRWVFSVTHPLRWCLPDDPGPGGLRVTWSYFDHRPYVEVDEDDREIYVEHHRTLGDRVREIVAAGLVLRRRRRAGVAAGPRPGLGPVVALARPDGAGDRHLRHPEALSRSARSLSGSAPHSRE